METALPGFVIGMLMAVTLSTVNKNNKCGHIHLISLFKKKVRNVNCTIYYCKQYLPISIGVLSIKELIFIKHPVVSLSRQLHDHAGLHHDHGTE